MHCDGKRVLSVETDIELVTRLSLRFQITKAIFIYDTVQRRIFL